MKTTCYCRPGGKCAPCVDGDFLKENAELVIKLITLESENARLKEEARYEAWKYFILELARRLCHLPVTDFPAQRLILADMRRIFSEYDTEESPNE